MHEVSQAARGLVERAFYAGFTAREPASDGAHTGRSHNASVTPTTNGGAGMKGRLILLFAAVALVVTATAAAAVIRGTNGSDNINGTNDADLIYAKAGNDSVR